MLTGSHRTRLAAVTLMAAALAVVGAPAATPAAPPNAPAHHSISTLLAEPDAQLEAVLPADFSTRFGYQPQVRDGLTGAPHGDCSSPVPLPREFTPACRQHDLGYDLLRYADAAGEPLPPQARRALDDRLAAQNRAACRERRSGPSRATCMAWAAIADAAVSINTWRQNAGAPGSESPRSVLASGGLAVAGIGTTALALVGLRRKGDAR